MRETVRTQAGISVVFYCIAPFSCSVKMLFGYADFVERPLYDTDQILKFWTLHTADEVRVKTPCGEHGYRDLQVWDNCW